MKTYLIAILTSWSRRGETVSRWFPAGLVLELQRELGREVDVVTETGLNPYLREHVLEEALPL